MNNLKFNFDVSVRAKASDNDDLGTIKDILNKKISKSFVYGSPEDEGTATLLWHDRSVLAPSGDETILLSDLEDAFGDQVILGQPKAIYIVNTSHLVWGTHTVATDASITVGNAVADAFPIFDAGSYTVTLHPTDCLLFISPRFAIVASSDQLKILNNDAVDKALYDILIIGHLPPAP